MLNWWRWEFVQPIAVWMCSWSLSNVQSLVWIRRQMGGSMPSRVILNWKTVVEAVFAFGFSLLIFFGVIGPTIPAWRRSSRCRLTSKRANCFLPLLFGTSAAKAIAMPLTSAMLKNDLVSASRLLNLLEMLRTERRT